MSKLGVAYQHDIPFKLFSDCIPVKGKLRSLIADLGRESYYLIPNSLHDILMDFDGESINYILSKFEKSESTVILEYFNFLANNSLIFFTNNPTSFPKLDITKWKHPAPIYQALIDIGVGKNFINQELFDSLNNLNCQYLEIRFFRKATSGELKELLERANDTSLIGINLYLEYPGIDDVNLFRNVFNSFLRVNNVIFYNAPKNETVLTRESGLQNILLTTQKINGCESCGIIAKQYFNVNIKSFTKAANCNSCLHGKVGIDIEGDIKNCPSMKENFGNIQYTTLENAISQKNFQKIWKIKKDDIRICKDCEFRYVCTDCRAYLEDPDDIYSKPLKCGYNPYTCEWQDWSKNPLKKDSIVYYNLPEVNTN